MLPASLPEDILFKLALIFIEGVGPKKAKVLLRHFGTPARIFSASVKELMAADGLGEMKAKAVKDPKVFERAAQELKFIEKEQIQLIFIDDEQYPERLKLCADAPLLLFYKGMPEYLNTAKHIAVIGTRKNTDYGLRLCEELVDGLVGKNDVVIYSGLAFGIDAIAHRAAVKSGLPTVGVLGHGLDRIYPFTNKGLANEMLLNGGLLTEFPSGTVPDRTNFPMRNRIVAGNSDVTVVVESDASGGAMITARLAASYNREVAAFPGRVHDARSAGCNLLIRNNEAALITSATDLLSLMNWDTRKEKKSVQRTLLLALTDEEQLLVDILQQKEKMHTDEVHALSGMPSSSLAAILLSLEMQGLVRSLPGKYYQLN